MKVGHTVVVVVVVEVMKLTQQNYLVFLLLEWRSLDLDRDL